MRHLANTCQCIAPDRQLREADRRPLASCCTALRMRAAVRRLSKTSSLDLGGTPGFLVAPYLIHGGRDEDDHRAVTDAGRASPGQKGYSARFDREGPGLNRATRS